MANQAYPRYVLVKRVGFYLKKKVGFYRDRVNDELLSAKLPTIAFLYSL
jgi:hypothetical protein